MRRTPLRSRPHRVTVEERSAYAAVEARDQGCVAPRLDPASGDCSGRLTRQHVKTGPGGARITDEAHLVMLCEHHHLWSGWATSKGGLLLQRMYLAIMYPDAWSG